MKELGKTYKDLVTGFTGVAAARIHYLTGCDQLRLDPPYDAKAMKLPDSMWFDETRLVEVKGAKKVVLQSGNHGGPAPASLPTNRMGS